MSTPEPQSPEPQPPAPAHKDRVYRSSGAIAGGVVLLAIVGWLGIDAVIAGDGRTPWMALATLIFVVPLVAAFTLRPAVHANDDRLRIRNPFRVIVLPWSQVAVLRSGYTNEVLTESGAKYQLWAVPVSLRARKKAARREARATAEQVEGGLGRGGRAGGPGAGLGLGGGPRRGGGAHDGPMRAEADQIMDDLRELHEARHGAATAQGEVTVRWAYEVLGPAAVGAALLVVLVVIG
jgi:uncharacterized membrane protein YgcG